MNTDLKDPRGKLIGKIRDTRYRLEIRNPNGKLLGWYDPKSNVTKTSTGKLVGKGNLLTSLL
jgi:hypothetical protein